jgi:hypothetical protein
VKTSEEYEAFTQLVDCVLAVPHAEIMRREAEYKKQSAMNPHRRGPKRKISPKKGGDDSVVGTAPSAD